VCTLKDLDQEAATLASSCQMLLDASLPDDELRTKLFEKIPCDTLTQALDHRVLNRPADNVYRSNAGPRCLDIPTQRAC